MDVAAHPITIGKQTRFGSWERVACRVHLIGQSGDGVKVPRQGCAVRGQFLKFKDCVAGFFYLGLVSSSPELFYLRFGKTNPELLT
jgi:hypothetical protein